jgi:hypothetical protein
MKKRILKILKRDGEVDLKAFPPEYRWNLCSARLRYGDFDNWDGWEFRSPWFMTFNEGKKCPIKKWDGLPVKHLIVLGEQGVGDEILFLSALPELMVRFGKGIEWMGYPKLNPIVERSFGVKVTPRKLLGEIMEGDAVLAIGDLFRWYRTDRRNFPGKPFLKPDPEKVIYWRKWLEQFPKPWVGMAWHSRHGFLDPKSLDLNEGTVFNLQYGESTGYGIKPPFDTKDDMEAMFAFVSNLDYVNTVSQTLVHICGAIGKECHAVIPPKNGEVKWYLWYYYTVQNKDFWQMLPYRSVTVYRDIDSYERNRSSGRTEGKIDLPDDRISGCHTASPACG